MTDLPDWDTQTRELDPSQRVRVTRTVIYEGSVSWIRGTLSRSMVAPNQPPRLFVADASIACAEETIEVLETK